MRNHNKISHCSIFIFWIFVSFTAGVSGQEFDIPTMVMDRSMHFLTKKGRDRVIKAGVYGVTSNIGSSILTILPLDGSEPIDIQGEMGTHQENINATELHSLFLDDNEFHVVLMTPEGHTFEAVGTQNGIRSRSGNPLFATKLFGSKILRSGVLFPKIRKINPNITKRKKVYRPARKPTIKMTVTGTGKLETLARFNPYTLITKKFTVTGTGKLEARGIFSPQKIRVNRMKVTGKGQLR